MLLLAFALFYFTISDLLKCFLHVLCNHQYSLGTAVAASHVLPTQRMIVMSCVSRQACLCICYVMENYHMPCPVSFILVYSRCAHLKYNNNNNNNDRLTAFDPGQPG